MNNKRRNYQKPVAADLGIYPEPVDAGCCLRSCGGGPVNEPGPLKQQSSKTLEQLEKAIKRCGQT